MAGRRTDRAGDRGPGQEVVVLKQQPRAPPAPERCRGEHRPHSPRHEQVGLDVTRERPQLTRVRGQAQRRRDAVAHAPTQLERPLAKLDHVQPVGTSTLGEWAPRAGQGWRLGQPAGDVEKQPLGTAQNACIAHEQGWQGRKSSFDPRTLRPSPE